MNDEKLVQSNEDRQELAKQKLQMLIRIMRQMMNPTSADKSELMEYDCVH